MRLLAFFCFFCCRVAVLFALTAPVYGQEPMPLWVCPMHPDVMSHLPEERCPQCGMTLQLQRAGSEEQLPPSGLARGEHMSSEDEGAIAHWTCPMHPGVRQSQSAACPICGMALTPVTRAELVSGVIVVDALRRQRFGVTLSEARMRNLKRLLHLPATVAWDEAYLYDVNIRAAGWIERVLVIEPGSRIKRGDPLAVFYSPAMYSAQRELLASRGSNRQATKLEQLKLLGLTREQVAALLESGEPSYTYQLLAPRDGVIIALENVIQGNRLEAGTRFARIAQQDRLRVSAEVYADDLPLIQSGAHVLVNVASVTEPLHGKVSAIDPWAKPDTRRATVRISLDDSGEALVPGMFVQVQLPAPLGHVLAIPAQAVIHSGRRQIVFVDQGADRLVPRDIVAGHQAGEWIEVRQGLQPGDKVVSSGTFLIAAESRLRAAQTYWGASDHGH